MSLYLSTGQLDTIQTSLEVYKLLTDRNIYEAFRYYTNDDKALELAKELTAVYEKYDYISFPSDKDFGERIYRDLKNVTAFVISKIRKTAEETHYLIRYPEEISIDLEREKEIIRNNLECFV